MQPVPLFQEVGAVYAEAQFLCHGTPVDLLGCAVIAEFYCNVENFNCIISTYKGPIFDSAFILAKFKNTSWLVYRTLFLGDKSFVP